MPVFILFIVLQKPLFFNLDRPLPGLHQQIFFFLEIKSKMLEFAKPCFFFSEVTWISEAQPFLIPSDGESE